ncbi:MAG: hypothetical protein B6244_05675 [Candidatus Cloacimonetes bacterium 4572_55]|nr:MAG: hypothetical protein B6244_05675 [Candidatus Cloacimonetes bacterium 4572_55]
MTYRHLVYALFFPFILSLASCFEREEKDDSPVIARVNGETLTLNELKRKIPREYLDSFRNDEKLEFVEQWVRQQLLYQSALEANLQKDSEVRFRLKEFEEQLLADEALRRKLEEESRVSDEEAKAYYDAHEDEFMREETEARLSHIVISNQKRATDIRKRIKDGEDFSALAKEFSEDQMGAENGGDLGYFSESEALDDLTQAALKLKVNRVSKPIKTGFGYHLVLVTDRKEVGSIREFEQVKQDIFNNLALKKQKKWTHELIKQLEQNATIETHPEILEKL